MGSIDWFLWMDILRDLAARAARLAPEATCECHCGQPDPHTARGARAHRLRQEHDRRMKAFLARAKTAGP